MARAVLTLDQGTTSSRAILFAHSGEALATAQQEFPQIYPTPGHVEHDPEAIWTSQLETAREAIRLGGIRPEEIAALGVTNQRETTILWERDTGKPVANAIVWQSRITAPRCEQLKSDGLSETFARKTGLVVDAYFSGTKIAHLLETIPGLRSRAERGEILFGTVETFLIWRLTGGKVHVTDVSNASRTLLFNIHTLEWDDELLKILNIPRKMLPEVRSSSEVYGTTDPALLGGGIPIAGAAGDQQAATFGQACFRPGDVKNTYGTGCFLLMNIGSKATPSKSGLLTTVGWKVGSETVYCLEGAVFIAGAVVQWLRDELKVISKSVDVEKLAGSVPDSGGVVFVPAFVGLGAPYWDPDARGAIFGLTRGSTQAHIARAAVESMALQTRDVVAAMEQDAGVRLASLKVDGGASRNNALMQFQADLLDVIVRRPVVQETTALGAAYLAGLATGFWADKSEIEKNWILEREFQPSIAADVRDRQVRRWKTAIERTRGWNRDE